MPLPAPPIEVGGDDPPDLYTPDELLEELSRSNIQLLPAWQPSEGSRADRLEVERASNPAGW